MKRADVRVEPDPDLEDRAAELVDRDWLLTQEHVDRAAARAELLERDRAELTRRATEWEAIKERSGHPSDYGWRGDSPWSDVL